MTMTEMAKLLMTASLIDPRLGRKSNEERLAMAAAWLEIIDERVTAQFAGFCLQQHYATSSETFMPVHIQSRFKEQRRKDVDSEQMKQIQASNHPSKGMPPEVRVQLRHLGLIK